MKNKWQASQVRAAQQWLQDTWPALFTPGPDLKPLSVKIHKDILQHPQRPAVVSRRALVEALKRHTRSFGYLFGLAKNTHRFNLNTEPVEVIEQPHRDWAQRTLRRQQKVAQAARRKRPSLRGTRPGAIRVAPPAKRANTQITYKKTRRRLLLKPITPQTSPAGTDTVAA